MAGTWKADVASIKITSSDKSEKAQKEVADSLKLYKDAMKKFALTLLPDGTYSVIQADGSKQQGKYTFAGKILTLSPDKGKPADELRFTLAADKAKLHMHNENPSGSFDLDIVKA